MNKEKFENLIKNSKSRGQAVLAIGYNQNGWGYKKLDENILFYNIDTTHFNRNWYSAEQKIPRIKKMCPVCRKEFESLTKTKETTTCSKGCSNTYFRSGRNHPNWKEDDTKYRRTCFEHYQHKCAVCNENLVIEVHHLDHNRDNNIIDNLIPLCPTHHKYMHRGYKNIIEDKLNKFILKYGVCSLM